MRFNNLKGKSFGKLSVVHKCKTRRNGNVVWLCQCACGKRKKITGVSLTTHGTKSCGCLAGEKSSEKTRTHGMYSTSIYQRYHAMIQRCHNPKCRNYKNYGKRGIQVCSRWRKSFEAFFRDMGNPPKGRSLERRDNNKGYSPTNCLWATRKEQSSNHRRSRRLTYKGKTQTLTQWACEKNIAPATLDFRLRRGWSMRRSLNEPLHLGRWHHAVG